LKLVVGDTKISFCVSDAVVIEFVHDQCQINPLHSGVISPGLSETVSAIVAPQTDFMADGRNEFPGLSPFDVLLSPGVEEEIALAVFQDERICFKVFNQSFFHALIDGDFMALSPLLLLDPKAIFDLPTFIDELISLEY
jgi:hypothetical protein